MGFLKIQLRSVFRTYLAASFHKYTVMRKKNPLLSLLPLLLVLLLAFSCGKKEKPEIATEDDLEKAEETTEEFFEALKEHDFEKAQTHVTAETRPILEAVLVDAKKHQTKHKEKPDISVVVLERKPLLDRVDLIIKLMVGKKVRKETLKLVLVEDDWRIVLPRKQLALVNLIVFYEPYQIVLVQEKKHKHHGQCHARGHHKHKHKHKHHSDDDHHHNDDDH